MTFARGNIRGYDDDRMVLLFSMMDGAREVPCAVSAAAMDELEHVPRTPADRREEQFARLRDRIEACASRKFEAREFEALPPASSCAASISVPEDAPLGGRHEAAMNRSRGPVKNSSALSPIMF